MYSRIDVTGEIEERQLMGDGAYLPTRIELTVQSASRDEAVRRSGYTLSILRKEADGRWRLARDADLVTAHE